jgi:hypothetical protein
MTYTSAYSSTAATSTLQCRRCGKEIKFDDRHVSQKTGKKIPLDAKTGQRHDCPLLCSKGCGSQIYFDVNTKTQSGNWIPLDKRTGLRHQCHQQ